MVRKKVVAMLLAGGQGSRLSVLTNRMAKPAVPFGGKYRIIDFPLSNCVNSNIDTVGVLTQYEPLELNAYIGTGQAWDLDRNSGGVFVLPPYQSSNRGRWYSGTANAIFQNMAFIDIYDPEYVLILSGDHIYKMDYALMLDYHISKKADLTVAVRTVPMEEAHRFGIMNTDGEGRIVEFEEKPKHPKGNKASMGIYIFSWPVLKKYLILDEQNKDSENDFGKNVIPSILNAGLRAFAYSFDAYWKDVGTVQSLWEANMDLISDDPPIELNDPDWRIYSKSPCMPPHCVGGNATIKRSSITEGCNIYGTVMHSVIFAGVDIEEGAEVVDSVVMPGAVIRSGAKVHRAIIGENSIVGEDSFVGAERRPEDGEYNTSLTDDITLIASDTEIEAGRRVPVGMIVNATRKEA